jgi:hypothetical protein
LTFFYKDEYGNQKEYRTIDITGMTDSQINAATARMFGEMHDMLNEEYEPTPIPDSDPALDFAGEEIERLQSQNELLLRENEELRWKVHILKELVREG